MDRKSRGERQAVEVEIAGSSEKNRGGYTPLRPFLKENSRGSGSFWTAPESSFFSARSTNKESPPVHG